MGSRPPGGGGGSGGSECVSIPATVLSSSPSSARDSLQGHRNWTASPPSSSSSSSPSSSSPSSSLVSPSQQKKIDENFEAGKRLFRQSDFSRAEFFMKLVYSDCMLHFGPDHPRTTESEKMLCRTQFEMSNSRNFSRVTPDMLRFTVKEGWLTKRGGAWKNWKKRWFVLEGTNLYYFRKERNERPKGVIHVGQHPCSVCDGSEIRCPSPCLKIEATRRTYYARGQDEDDVLAWCEIIQQMQELDLDVSQIEL